MSILINDGNSDNDKVVKCDIGSFVLCYERLKRYIYPVVDGLSYLVSIVRWERPLHTVFWIVLLLALTISNPVYLLISLLLPIPPFLIMEFVRGCGKRVKPEKEYKDYFERKSDASQQQLKEAQQELWREHLRIYIEILISLQELFIEVTAKIEYIKSIISWKRPHVSMFVLLSFFTLEFSLYILDFRNVVVAVIFVVFFVNKYFFLAISSSWNRLKSSLSSLVTRSETSTNRGPIENVHEQSTFEQHEHGEMEMELKENDLGDPFYYHSSCSSSDDADDDNEHAHDMVDATDKKLLMDAQPPENASSSSFTKFWYRSLRRRDKRTDTCTNCDQPCSSILTKRRYCRQCGHSFCSKCCHIRLPRALLGATAPAAYQEKVLVCVKCHVFLTNRSKTEL